MTISRTGQQGSRVRPAYTLPPFFAPAISLANLAHAVPGRQTCSRSLRSRFAGLAALPLLLSLTACSLQQTTLDVEGAENVEKTESTAPQLRADRYLSPLTANDHQLLSDSSLFNAEGLRSGRYRAPVPSLAPGATTLSDNTFLELKRKNKLLLIDVLPATLREGRFINTKQHKTIPGSFWLANTGKADASEAVNRYFRTQLTTLTTRFPDKTPVFFCKTDCWMSWNAAAKASGLGVTPIYWYPAGVDGWQQNGGELVLQPPVPLQNSGETALTQTE